MLSRTYTYFKAKDAHTHTPREREREVARERVLLAKNGNSDKSQDVVEHLFIVLFHFLSFFQLPKIG